MVVWNNFSRKSRFPTFSQKLMLVMRRITLALFFSKRKFITLRRKLNQIASIFVCCSLDYNCKVLDHENGKTNGWL